MLGLERDVIGECILVLVSATMGKALLNTMSGLGTHLQVFCASLPGAIKRMSVTSHTDVGDIKIEVFCKRTPKTCEVSVVMW